MYAGSFGETVQDIDLPDPSSLDDGVWLDCISDEYNSIQASETFSVGDVAVVQTGSWVKILSVDVARTRSNWTTTIDALGEIMRSVDPETFLKDPAGKVKYLDALVAAINP